MRSLLNLFLLLHKHPILRGSFSFPVGWCSCIVFPPLQHLWALFLLSTTIAYHCFPNRCMFPAICSRSPFTHYLFSLSTFLGTTFVILTTFLYHSSCGAIWLLRLSLDFKCFQSEYILFNLTPTNGSSGAQLRTLKSILFILIPVSAGSF